MRKVERQLVERALAQTNGNISEAAQLSNMERATLSRWPRSIATAIMRALANCIDPVLPDTLLLYEGTGLIVDHAAVHW
ncbi:helix-turn-helix domain-containing protein [Pseudoduganella lutea]|uniref:helix-turn-helix domain-containing protein n=1 Tax=Pseudoduganella lutea TaxID=321985 RepID=UPI001A91B050|nr:helix-turn-helix domain-containing protein [Pseudoduganella lutea]